METERKPPSTARTGLWIAGIAAGVIVICLFCAAVGLAAWVFRDDLQQAFRLPVPLENVYTVIESMMASITFNSLPR